MCPRSVGVPMDDTKAIAPPPHTRTRVGDGTAVEAIICAVAEAEGTSPLHLDPPLHDVVDPDTLDRLFAPTRDGVGIPEGRVVFPYRGHEVTLHADGRVTIGPRGEL